MDEEHHKTYYERDFKTGKCNEKWSTNVSGVHIAADNGIYHPLWIYTTEKSFPIHYPRVPFETNEGYAF